ncbi:MAG: hypothetical protein AB1476_02740 [Candidatus Hadarchaeota archaeon]
MKEKEGYEFKQIYPTLSAELKIRRFRRNCLVIHLFTIALFVVAVFSIFVSAITKNKHFGYSPLALSFTALFLLLYRVPPDKPRITTTVMAHLSFISVMGWAIVFLPWFMAAVQNTFPELYFLVPLYAALLFFTPIIILLLSSRPRLNNLKGDDWLAAIKEIEAVRRRSEYIAVICFIGFFVVVIGGVFYDHKLFLGF